MGYPQTHTQKRNLNKEEKLFSLPPPPLLEKGGGWGGAAIQWNNLATSDRRAKNIFQP